MTLLFLALNHPSARGVKIEERPHRLLNHHTKRSLCTVAILGHYRVRQCVCVCVYLVNFIFTLLMYPHFTYVI